MIYGLVLAAGESQRMGRPKLLLPLGEETVIENVLNKIKASKLTGCLVVVNLQDKIITELARRFSFAIVINPNPERGMLSSIIAGISQLPPGAEAMVVFLGDQPLITSTLVDLLIVSYRVKGKGIVVPTYQGKRGHPVLIDLKYRQEIVQLNPETGLRSLLWQHPEDVLELPVEEAGVTVDLDTAEDYLRLLQELSAKNKS